VIRALGLTVLTSALLVTLVVAGDDEPAPAKGANKDEPAKKAEPVPKQIKPLPEEKAGEQPPEGPQEKIEDILKRLNENFETTSENLAKKDPGTDTRTRQKKIIEDLDKLINQQNNSDCNCKNSSSSSSSSSSQSKSSASKSSQKSSQSQSQANSKSNSKGSSQQPNAGKDSQQAKGEQKGGQKKEDGQQKQDQAGNKKEQEKKDGQGQKKEETAKKDGEKNDGNGGSLKNKSDAKEKTTIADLNREVWGHLSEKKRMELDVHARERFMPKYQELLRQYYRNIAEQNQKKGGD
jgi:hypothetical protein